MAERHYSPAAYKAVVDYLLGAVGESRLRDDDFRFTPTGLHHQDMFSKARYLRAILAFTRATNKKELAAIIAEACIADPHAFISGRAKYAIARYINIGEVIEQDIAEHFKAVDNEHR